MSLYYCGVSDEVLVTLDEVFTVVLLLSTFIYYNHNLFAVFFLLLLFVCLCLMLSFFLNDGESFVAGNLCAA